MKNSEDNEAKRMTMIRLDKDIAHLSSPTIDGIEFIPVSPSRRYWHACINGPTDSPYEGGKFYLHIYLPLKYVHEIKLFFDNICIFQFFFFSYPFQPPKVIFLTKIIHPNVSRHGDIGLDILKENYCTSLGIFKIVLSIQSILCDPFTKVSREI